MNATNPYAPPQSDLLLICGEARQCVHDEIADTIVIRA
jgi:hypothetical protein